MERIAAEQLSRNKSPKTIAWTETPEELLEHATPENLELIIGTLLYYLRDDAEQDLKQKYITIIRMLVQKVAIGSTLGHHPAELTLHGRIAAILVAI